MLTAASSSDDELAGAVRCRPKPRKGRWPRPARSGSALTLVCVSADGFVALHKWRRGVAAVEVADQADAWYTTRTLHFTPSARPRVGARRPSGDPRPDHPGSEGSTTLLRANRAAAISMVASLAGLGSSTGEAVTPEGLRKWNRNSSPPTRPRTPRSRATGRGTPRRGRRASPWSAGCAVRSRPNAPDEVLAGSRWTAGAAVCAPLRGSLMGRIRDSGRDSTVDAGARRHAAQDSRPLPSSMSSAAITSRPCVVRYNMIIVVVDVRPADLP
jgi:hypothetical protein